MEFGKEGLRRMVSVGGTRFVVGSNMQGFEERSVPRLERPTARVNNHQEKSEYNRVILRTHEISNIV